MIEMIADELGEDLYKLLEDEGGSGIYPPPNMKVSCLCSESIECENF